jgi:hypothetical protein
MPDDLDIRDDREEAHEDGGDDEVSIITAGSGRYTFTWNS